MVPRVCSITAYQYASVFSVPFPWHSLVIDIASTAGLVGLLRMPRPSGAAGLRTIHTQELQISGKLRQVSKHGRNTKQQKAVGELSSPCLNVHLPLVMLCSPNRARTLCGLSPSSCTCRVTSTHSGSSCLLFSGQHNATSHPVHSTLFASPHQRPQPSPCARSSTLHAASGLQIALTGCASGFTSLT